MTDTQNGDAVFAFHEALARRMIERFRIAEPGDGLYDDLHELAAEAAQPTLLAAYLAIIASEVS